MTATSSALTELFRSTPLREGRRTKLLLIPPYRLFRSTPLREGRLSCNTALFPLSKVALWRERRCDRMVAPAVAAG